VAEPYQFGFAADGEWLVAAGPNGVLHGLALDGSPPEVLPRAYRDGAVLTRVDAVLGVNGGVVVCGRMTPVAGRGLRDPVSPAVTVTIATPLAPVMTSTGTWGEETSFDVAPAIPVESYVVAHYDRAARRVRLHVIGPAAGSPRWAAFPALHCVAVRPTDPPYFQAYAFDLDNLERYSGPPNPVRASRARSAWEMMTTGGTPPYTLPVLTRTLPEPAGRAPFAVLVGNTVHIRRTDPRWLPFEPQRDGKPMIAGTTFARLELAGEVLAGVLVNAGRRERTLVLFRGPDGAVIAELSHANREAPFKLSTDGTFLARRRGRWEVAVSRTADPGRPLTVAGPARLHTGLEISLTAHPFRLFIHVGGFGHIFSETDGRLGHVLNRGLKTTRFRNQVVHDLPTRYDPARFPSWDATAEGGWWAVADRLGQVILYAGAGKQVASFLVRRERAAAWAPGGAFWGDPALIGGPPTPGADRIIGQAIRDAGRD
jgi:hypothetical protein